jgi:DNA polymerase (family 10)
MENVEIARMFHEYADLLDIQGESPFRVRAYRKAAQTLEGLSRPVAQLVEQGADLTLLPGIGSHMAEHIREILATGTLAALEEIRHEFPRTLATLVRVEGIESKRCMDSVQRPRKTCAVRWRRLHNTPRACCLPTPISSSSPCCNICVTLLGSRR